MKQGTNLAEKNGMWKGDRAGLDAIHWWVRQRFPKPKLCQNCKKVPPIDLANISQRYKRDVSDWKWLCRRCHMLEDGRMNNLTYRRKKRFIICFICNKKKLHYQKEMCKICCEKVRYYSRRRKSQTSLKNLTIKQAITLARKKVGTKKLISS